MKNCKYILAAIALVAEMAMGWQVRGDDAKPIYENNFEQAAVGKAPDEFLVLDGDFEVKEEGGNKFLELPGAPLDSFGVLFGPTEKSDVAVSARIFGTKKGEAISDVRGRPGWPGGYRLQVSPAKDALEIYQGDQVVASTPFEWKSGTWTMMALQITKAGEAWKVAGKAWAQGSAEPAQAMVTYDEKTEPHAGRASVWGSPFAGTAIRFDDLLLKQVETGKRN